MSSCPISNSALSSAANTPQALLKVSLFIGPLEKIGEVHRGAEETESRVLVYISQCGNVGAKGVF